MNFKGEERRIPPDAEHRHEVSDLMAERLADRRRATVCLDVRNPDYAGPDEDEGGDESRIYAFAEAHRARQLAAKLTRDQIAGLVAESLREMLAADEREDVLPRDKLDQVRINLAAWDLVKARP